jgi:tetratricopeptide (TPR) repeat protein
VQPEGQDNVVRVLLGVILVAVALVITVVLYALIAGVINPPAPRTAVEFALQRSEAAVKARPGSGKDWADYVTLLMQTGDMGEAKKQLKKARRLVKDKTLVYLNNVDMAILVSESKFKEAYAASDGYLKFDEKVRGDAIKEYGARGIVVTPEVVAGQNQVTAELLTYRARAAAGLKKYDKALEALDFALQSSPGASDILVLRAAVHIQAGDKKAAIADFREALTYIPDYQPALDGLKALGAKPASSTATTPHQ